MARIDIRNTETGQIKNVEEIILTPHLIKRGWVKHEVPKFEGKTKEPKEVKEEVKIEVKPTEVAEDEPVEFVPEPEVKETKKETKPAATRGRKPKK